MRFGARLKQARIKRQLTQQLVADHLSVSRQTISSWETENSYPDIDSLIKLSNFYQLSLDVLLKEDVGMKEYLKKQEVLDWIRPIKWFTVAIDIIFVGSLVFIKHQGLAEALLLLIGLGNLLVMMRVGSLTEELTGKSRISRLPAERKFIWPLVVLVTLIVGVEWYLKLQPSSDAVSITIGLWLGGLMCEAIYHYRKNKGTL